jgi:phage shock protein E
VIAVVIVVVFLLKRSGQISAQEARERLKDGALVIDVRSAGEFKAGHLSSAINIPLDQLEAALPLRVQDKNQVLLLHCQSGIRSGMAQKKLQAMGYAKAFNLGSLSHARDIVGDAGDGAH